ncbi:hypothetical protein E4T50_15385 [Aureobasidium sp. EXF-12298]|nr:hypothetical protein E4T50_15385 [Aureobasidium sp. EXF-12298]
MPSRRELHRLTMDMENDNTDRRIAEFRRNLQTYEEMSNQNRSSDPDSGYRTATPEPTFVADPDSPHLAPSPHLHPNITTRAQKRHGRRFSDLFTISHRGRNTPTPTFDRENRPKISRPIVDQGEIEVPHNGPYIYNHPSRPRLDVEIPRSSFSDLWGQRYGPIGDDGYNVDAVQHEVRNTQSVDFSHLLGGRQNYRHDTRRHGVSLGGIGDWNNHVAATSTTELTGGSEHRENAEENDDMDASYLAPLVSPTLQSSSSSITASASLPSISNLPPLPPSIANLPPLPPSPVALDEEPLLPPPAPEEEVTRSPSPITREPSERWIRRPLLQNPPTRQFIPPPPPPPSSPIQFPSTPSPAAHWPALQHFRPSCGVLISNVGNTAMVQPFLVTPDYDDHMSFESSEASNEESVVQVREDTPPPVARRLFVGTAGSTGASEVPAQPRQRKESRGLRSLCCGLFPRRRHHTSTTDHPESPRQRQIFAPMTQRHIPTTHTTIPEEDEDEGVDADENNDQENQPPNVNRPSTILETLIDTDEHDETSNEVEQEEDEQEIRRRSVRHSWVTVSRWLE